MKHILTFDLGTSYYKVCLFDEQLQMVARHTVPVPAVAPEPGRCELPLPRFEDCLTASVKEVNRTAGGLHNVTKVCFASQANSFTLLDKVNAPLLPILLWTDRRAHEVGDFLREIAAVPNFYATTGIARLDNHFMVAKLRWLRLHSPELFEQTRRVCTISDYFIWWLTGNQLTEAGLAGLTGLIDIHKLDYRREVLDQLELSIDLFPTIHRAGCDAGAIRRPLVDEWGLSPECRLAMGCLDQYAGAIGAEITSPGDVCETTGTVLASVRCTHDISRDAASGVFQGPAFSPDLYYQMVFSNLSAGILERYRNRLPDCPSFEELDRLAEGIPMGADGLNFNKLSIDDESADTFIGGSDRHGRGEEVRAILEAVAQELKQQVSKLCGNQRAAMIKSCGGASRSRLWLDIKRQIVGCAIERVDSPEPTSLGAARLASWLR